MIRDEEVSRLVEKANNHIRNLRLAGGRDFAVGGYSDGLIVEQDMRGMMLCAADCLDEVLAELCRACAEHEVIGG